LILEVYRLHSKRYPANSGRGAALHGGRWNPPGVEAIYTAQSRSLAALEILVHYAVLPRDFVLTPIRIPEDRVVVARLQKDAQFPELQQTRDLTLNWFPSTAVLGVYWVIIPDERIYILNPAHPEFEYIEFLDSEPFKFDPRLKQIV
jgi:RES domain-containing protein